MTRSVFGNWEADFIAKRREQIFNLCVMAAGLAVLAMGFATILIFEH